MALELNFMRQFQYNWVSHPVFIQLHTAALLLPLDICTQSQSFFYVTWPAQMPIVGDAESHCELQSIRKEAAK